MQASSPTPMAPYPQNSLVSAEVIQAREKPSVIWSPIQQDTRDVQHERFPRAGIKDNRSAGRAANIQRRRRVRDLEHRFLRSRAPPSASACFAAYTAQISATLTTRSSLSCQAFNSQLSKLYFPALSSTPRAMALAFPLPSLPRSTTQVSFSRYQAHPAFSRLSPRGDGRAFPNNSGANTVSLRPFTIRGFSVNIAVFGRVQAAGIFRVRLTFLREYVRKRVFFFGGGGLKLLKTLFTV